jgi:hypothetical protein
VERPVLTRKAELDAFASFSGRLALEAREAQDRPVPDGEWGPIEIVRHLIAVEDEVWQTRLGALATGDHHPRWAWTEPGLALGYEDLPLNDVVAAFTAARKRTAAIVRGFDEARWMSYGTHATYGRLDVEGLLRLANDHDQEHLEGLRRQQA